jgi:hypothetical protein
LLRLGQSLFVPRHRKGEIDLGNSGALLYPTLLLHVYGIWNGMEIVLTRYISIGSLSLYLNAERFFVLHGLPSNPQMIVNSTSNKRSFVYAWFISSSLA